MAELNVDKSLMNHLSCINLLDTRPHPSTFNDGRVKLRRQHWVRIQFHEGRLCSLLSSGQTSIFQHRKIPRSSIPKTMLKKSTTAACVLAHSLQASGLRGIRLRCLVTVGLRATNPCTSRFVITIENQW